VKAYNLSIDYVLYEMSYANLILYSAVLPSYQSGKKRENGEGEVINGDDPANSELIHNIIAE